MAANADNADNNVDNTDNTDNTDTADTADTAANADNAPQETAEARRLSDDFARTANWKRWGPYLAERQWATVREDYSDDGDCWRYFPHDHARFRAYRWGEDGLMGATDRECRLCFAWAFWNGRDPILKERLFGLNGHEGNHGEDAKEYWFYTDATPTFSYWKTVYKYGQAAFPYQQLVEENARRGLSEDEFELADTGVFNNKRYWDIEAEYAKNGPNDLCIRLTAHNRGPEEATLHILPILWLRNIWSWGCTHEGCGPKGEIGRGQNGSEDSQTIALHAQHETLGGFSLFAETDAPVLFTENETNNAALFGAENASPYTKEAFHRYVVDGEIGAVNPDEVGTKAALHYSKTVGAGEAVTLRFRLCADSEIPDAAGRGAGIDAVFAARIKEADAFYDALDERESTRAVPASRKAQQVRRQAYAGLLQSRQFYHYSVADWVDGDPAQMPVTPKRLQSVRNREWGHLFNRDIISMPDKWEYPWYAAWDTAFHMIPMARIDPHFAREQLILFLREWYMHPNGQIPAYEFGFGDVNPPVHAWACWRVYQITGGDDRVFLARTFQKLLLNFTWWVNRKDTEGRNVFGGGFLGMDNVGVFDRSAPLGPGQRLDQADGTAWMAFYCVTMLEMALELAAHDPSYEDVASKFFEHYVAIVDAMTSLGGGGLWDETDGFYYDQFHDGDTQQPIRLRSLVGVVPLLAVSVLEQAMLDKVPGFQKRMNWFLAHRPDLGAYTRHSDDGGAAGGTPKRLLAVPSRKRLVRVLGYVLDEAELLSPFGIRSLSRVYADTPYQMDGGMTAHVRYTPGEGDSQMFGGNSNWRGPIWLPLNYLLVEALRRYHEFFGDELKVECPTGSGQMMNLSEVADEIARRLAALFLPDADGNIPYQNESAEETLWRTDPNWQDLILFYEHFHGDTGRGLGASHQTGWTALIATLLENGGGRV